MCVRVCVLRALANAPWAALVFTCLCLQCFASGCAQPSSAAQNQVSLFHRHRRTQRGTRRNEEPPRRLHKQTNIHVKYFKGDGLLWIISTSAHAAAAFSDPKVLEEISRETLRCVWVCVFSCHTGDSNISGVYKYKKKHLWRDFMHITECQRTIIFSFVASHPEDTPFIAYCNILEAFRGQVFNSFTSISNSLSVGKNVTWCLQCCKSTNVWVKVKMFLLINDSALMLPVTHMDADRSK